MDRKLIHTHTDQREVESGAVKKLKGKGEMEVRKICGGGGLAGVKRS